MATAPDSNAIPWAWESFARRWWWLAGQAMAVGEAVGQPPLPRGYARPAMAGRGASPAARFRAEAAWLHHLEAWLKWRDRQGLAQKTHLVQMDDAWLLRHPQWTGLVNPGLGASLEGLWHGATGRPWVGVWPAPAPAYAAKRKVASPTEKEESALAVNRPGDWLTPRTGPLVGATDCWLRAGGATPPGPRELAGFHASSAAKGDRVILSGFAPYAFTPAASLHTQDTALLAFEHNTPAGALQKTWAFGPHALGLHQTLTARPQQDTWVGQWWFLPCFEQKQRRNNRAPAASFRVRLMHREVSLPVGCAGRLAQCVGWVLSDPALGVSLVVDVDPAVWLVFFPCYSLVGRGEKSRPVFQGIGLYACLSAPGGKTLHQTWKITQVGV